MKSPHGPTASSRPPLNELSETRRSVLALIKRDGSASVARLAVALEVSYETIRQQVKQMSLEGWIVAERAEGRLVTAGRPTRHYRLTPAGEHLFPKQYAQLSTELIDVLLERFGMDGLRTLMTDLTEARVKRWGPQLTGLPLREKLYKLRGLYLEEDPYMSVEENEAGEMRLVERNCPFLAVATERPALCSLTVSTLSRLLGYQVVREKRFQNDDGKCVFRVLADRPLEGAFDFAFESDS